MTELHREFTFRPTAQDLLENPVTLISVGMYGEKGSAGLMRLEGKGVYKLRAELEAIKGVSNMFNIKPFPNEIGTSRGLTFEVSAANDAGVKQVIKNVVDLLESKKNILEPDDRDSVIALTNRILAPVIEKKPEILNKKVPDVAAAFTAAKAVMITNNGGKPPMNTRGSLGEVHRIMSRIIDDPMALAKAHKHYDANKKLVDRLLVGI